MIDRCGVGGPNAQHWEHLRAFIAEFPERSHLLFIGDRQVGFRDEISREEVSEIVQYAAEHASFSSD